MRFEGIVPENELVNPFLCSIELELFPVPLLERHGMFSFEPNPCSLAFLPGIFNNQLMHQHHPINGVVRNGVSIVNSDDLFKDNRPGFVDLVCIQDYPFEFRVLMFFLPSGISQFWDESGILVLLLQLVDPSSRDSYKPDDIVQGFPFLKFTDYPPDLFIG